MSIAHRLELVSPLPLRAFARTAHGHAFGRCFQNTFAHISAALGMSGARCYVPGLPRKITSAMRDAWAEPCVDEARYIDGHAPPNEACELTSRLLPQCRPQMMPASLHCVRRKCHLAICSGRPTPALRERTTSSDFRFADMTFCAVDSPHAPRPETQPLALSRALT